MKMNWLICIGGSDADGVEVHTFTGTRGEVRALLAEYVQDLIEQEEYETAEFYTRSARDVDPSYFPDNKNGYYAFVSFDTYHVDIEAVLMESITPIRRGK